MDGWMSLLSGNLCNDWSVGISTRHLALRVGPRVSEVASIENQSAQLSYDENVLQTSMQP